jgi:hypothetical protein
MLSASVLNITSKAYVIPFVKFKRIKMFHTVSIVMFIISYNIKFHTHTVISFLRLSRPALGPTQPPIQWVPGALSLGL